MAPFAMSPASVSVDFAAAGKPSAKAFLCSPVKKQRYLRRSTTTKAPRKRSFVANMTKYSEEQLRVAGIAAGGAQEAPLSSVCLDTGSGNNGGMGGGSGRKFGGAGGNDGSDSSRLPAPALFLAAAFAVAAAFVTAPMPSMAAIPLNAAGARRASVLGGATAAAPAPPARRRGGAAALHAEPEVIPYGRVFLTGSESKMLSERQYRVRETMRVYA